jgi:hypothetical protein
MHDNLVLSTQMSDLVKSLCCFNLAISSSDEEKICWKRRLDPNEIPNLNSGTERLLKRGLELSHIYADQKCDQPLTTVQIDGLERNFIYILNGSPEDLLLTINTFEDIVSRLPDCAKLRSKSLHGVVKSSSITKIKKWKHDDNNNIKSSQDKNIVRTQKAVKMSLHQLYLNHNS